jgi:hypothetical protein
MFVRILLEPNSYYFQCDNVFPPFRPFINFIYFDDYLVDIRRISLSVLTGARHTVHR